MGLENGASSGCSGWCVDFVSQTQIVIKDYEEAYHRQAPTTNRDVTGLGLRPKDSDVLLRILCHRADREASKFLKTVYNLPKH